MYLPILRMSAPNKARREILSFAWQSSAEKTEKMMPRITTDSGKTIDDVLQDDLFTHATVDYTDSDGVRHVEDVPVTRRGDSIVPDAVLSAAEMKPYWPTGTGPQPGELTINIYRQPASEEVAEVTAILGVEPRKDGPYFVYEDVDFSKCNLDIIPNLTFEIDVPASHRNDPHTSKTAAASVVQTASRHRELILASLKEIGPSTGHELAQHLGLEYVQVAKRLTELHDDDRIQRRIYESHAGEWGTYQTRPSPSGRQACVWHLNPLAKSTEPA